MVTTMKTPEEIKASSRAYRMEALCLSLDHGLYG